MKGPPQFQNNSLIQVKTAELALCFGITISKAPERFSQLTYFLRRDFSRIISAGNHSQTSCSYLITFSQFCVMPLMSVVTVNLELQIGSFATVRKRSSSSQENHLSLPVSMERALVLVRLDFSCRTEYPETAQNGLIDSQNHSQFCCFNLTIRCSFRNWLTLA